GGQSGASGGRSNYRQARRPPQPRASTASGQAARRGISEASTASGASTASEQSAPVTQREGRHSRRKAADALHQCVDVGIGGPLGAEEPAPQLVVLGVQQL